MSRPNWKALAMLFLSPLVAGCLLFGDAGSPPAALVREAIYARYQNDQTRFNELTLPGREGIWSQIKVCPDADPSQFSYEVSGEVSNASLPIVSVRFEGHDLGMLVVEREGGEWFLSEVVSGVGCPPLEAVLDPSIAVNSDPNIRYVYWTSDGWFEPTQGQFQVGKTIRFTNLSDHAILIFSGQEDFPELYKRNETEGLILQPNETFETQIEEIGVYIFFEKSTDDRNQIDVYERP